MEGHGSQMCQPWDRCKGPHWAQLVGALLLLRASLVFVTAGSTSPPGPQNHHYMLENEIKDEPISSTVPASFHLLSKASVAFGSGYELYL